jgi:MYXO-CTERM domain-containing protein
MGGVGGAGGSGGAWGSGGAGGQVIVGSGGGSTSKDCYCDTSSFDHDWETVGNHVYVKNFTLTEDYCAAQTDRGTCQASEWKATRFLSYAPESVGWQSDVQGQCQWRGCSMGGAPASGNGWLLGIGLALVIAKRRRS